MFDLHRNPLGIYEKALPDVFSWQEKMEAARLAGYDFMELSIDESDERLARLEWGDEQIAEVRAAVQESGITLSSMCLSGHRRFPFGSRDPRVRHTAYSIMEKAIVLCQKLGIPCIQLAAYDVYYEESDSQTKTLFLKGMRDSVAMASRAGIILALEIMDTEFIGTILRAVHYLREIPSPYFKIYPDMGNLSQFSADPESELELGISDIVAVHVKETMPGIFKNVPFGTGTVRFADLFAKLHDLNYTGRFMVEMWADNAREYTVEEAAFIIAGARDFVIDKMHEGGYTDL